MLIENQSGDKLVNTENATMIYIDDEYNVLAEFTNNRYVILGNYDNEYRANEVLEKIAQCYGAINTFVMPEK